MYFAIESSIQLHIRDFKDVDPLVEYTTAVNKMPVLCFGPVCIPLNLLLPFLLGVAHHYGWLKWIKREWLTFTWWKQQFSRGQAPAATSSTAQQQQAGLQAASGQAAEFSCEGGICRLVPLAVDTATAGSQQTTSSCKSAAAEAAGSKLESKEPSSELRHRAATAAVAS